MRTVEKEDLENALGPFTSLEEIGPASGSGECWKAEKDGATFAVKVIVKEHEPGRFERELEALKRIRSDRVMKVFGDGNLITQGGDTYPYMLSEFVPGGNLRDHMQQPPSSDELRAFLLEVCRGLTELHAVNVVHRDLKPENLILRHGDWTTPVIIDLGLSRLVDNTTFTVYPWAWGTWPYMAPEQLAADRALDRTDIWAVAVVAAELATGEHPFKQPRETSPPTDWDARLRGGIVVPGSRPAALHLWLGAAGQYRAYRRPAAVAAAELIEREWI